MVIEVVHRSAGAPVGIEQERAVFAVSPEIRTPMGGGIVAYLGATRAEEVAARYHGKVVRSVSELLNQKGEE